MEPTLAQLQDRYRAAMTRLNTGVNSRVDFDLTPLFPPTDHLTDLLAQVDDLKRMLESFRPFNPDQVANLERTITAAYTYESNRIEGNTLTLGETTLILEKGVTIAGKPLKEHLEVTGHAQAFEYIKRMAVDQDDLTDWSLRNIHQLILGGVDRKNAGAYRTIDVGIAGSNHTPPPHYLVQERMDEFFRVYQAEASTRHPVLLAADLHQRLVNIHPFVDGNGRTARLIMNLILLQRSYPIANISGESQSRHTYYNLLETAHTTGEIEPFQRLIAQSVKDSSLWYLHRISTSGRPEQGEYFFRRLAPLLRP
jgi:Fic family protein